MRKGELILAVLVVCYAALVCVLCGVTGPLDHDEHQFMAGAFMARHGLQPYRDFPYFHMPNLIYLYAPLFETGYPFLAARLLAGLCALGTAVAILACGRFLFAGRDGWARGVFPAAAALLFLHSPLLHFASSHVWNHAPSVLCAVLSVLLLFQGMRSARPAIYFLGSGAALGMAVGIRLSFAPLALPYLLAVLAFRPGRAKERALNTAAFTAGALAASLPSLYFLVTRFDRFLFGNLGYARLNAIYRRETGFETGMTFAGKLSQLRDSVFAKPGDFVILLVLLFGLALVGVQGMRRRGRPRFEVVFLLLLLPFLYLGCLAPTPGWYQYYFAAMPFLVLLGLAALSDLRGTAFQEAAGALMAVSVAAGFIYGSPLTNGAALRRFMSFKSWTPVQVHEAALGIRRLVPESGAGGRVLTLSPLFAVEAGLPVYEEFVTGPFAWRVSELLSEEEADRRRMPVPSRIVAFMEERRPAAVLTGAEPEVEARITAAAKDLGYRPTMLPIRYVLWRPPQTP